MDPTDWTVQSAFLSEIPAIVIGLFSNCSLRLSSRYHPSWLHKAFFDIIATEGGYFILVVTFTFIWTSEEGAADIDNNGRLNYAFAEIYYNDNFQWTIDLNYDVETVVLHEAGHGLSQGHYGGIFRDGAGGLLFAPLAVMNPAYSGIQ